MSQPHGPQSTGSRTTPRFLLEKHGRSWDDVALPGVSLADLDGRILDEYRHRGVESQRLPPQALNESDESVIERLRLRDGAHLKRAAVLLFHPEPHRFFMEASVKIGAFRGAELLYQDVIEGDLFTQVDRVMDLLYTKYSRGLVSYNDIYRVETFPVPRPAMREAVVNAVVHRDYATPASTQIRVYDDRITLRNAARLPPDWTAPVTGGLQSRPHNPRAAHGFYRAGMIEAWGRGIRRIGEFCREAGNPGPIWTPEPGGVLCLRFPFSEAYQAADREARQVGRGRNDRRTAGDYQKAGRATQKTTHKESGTTQKPASNDTRRRIVALMRDNPRITQTRIAERLGITRYGVAYHARQLQADRVIRRVGSRKSGHWEVLDS